MLSHLMMNDGPLTPGRHTKGARAGSGSSRQAAPGPRPRKARRAPPLERLLRQRATTLLRRRKEVKEEGDPDAIHDLRVATRRLQEVLDLFEPVLPREARERARRRIRRIRHDFAEVRDADVLYGLVRGMRAGSAADEKGAIAPLERRLRLKADRLRRELSGGDHGAPRVAGIRKRLGALLEHLEERPADPDLVARAARIGLARRARELERARRSAASGRPLPAHRLRVAVKRWRYALEILDASSLGPFTEAIEAARRVQEKLGALHDLDVLILLVGRGAGTRSLRTRLAAKRRDLWNEARPLVAAYSDETLRGLRGLPRPRSA
ncbi:MAG TPA: CHAD domain-containing protein [Candidatus Polarisedimenticolia bacterium]|nr:CHAD domain-containing protein [Candidatus Polarisedimenticolia bacterium]